MRLRTVHAWAGLSAGLLASAIGISGSILLFRTDIVRHSRGVPASVACLGSPLPLEDLLTGALRVSPQAKPLMVSLAARGNGTGASAPPEILLLTPGGRVSLLTLSPCSGRVLGTLSGDEPTWADTVARFHHSLALGAFGRWVVAAVAVTLAFLTLSGVRLFLRGPRPFHAWLGLASSLLLLLYALSGLTFLFWRSPPPPQPVLAQSAVTRASLDRLARSAVDAVPGAALSWIEFPASSTSPFSVRLRTPGDLRLRGSTTVYLHPATARVLRVDHWGGLPFGLRLYHVFAALHFGEAGGARLRWFWFIAGLLPMLLWTTGLLLRARSARPRL